ncbi:MAG TPA: hypothetical protein VGB72_08945 [Acidobacteriota bacterium]
MRFMDAERTPCKLFLEVGPGTFDQLDVEYKVDPQQNLSRKMAMEIEQNPMRTVFFHYGGGLLPVQGSFICLPFDASRPFNQAYLYESKMFPKTMSLEILQDSPTGAGLYITAKYRDSLAKTRLQQVIDRNSALPIFFVQKVVIPLRSGIFEWTPELKDNILILRLWNNKILRFAEVKDIS